MVDKASHQLDLRDKFAELVDGVYTINLPSTIEANKHGLYANVAVADLALGVHNYKIVKTYPDGRVETIEDTAEVTSLDANQVAVFGSSTKADNTKFTNNWRITELSSVMEKGTYTFEFTIGSVSRKFTVNLVDRPQLKVSGVKIGSTDLVLYDGEFVRPSGALSGAQAISVPFTKVNLTDANFYTVEVASLITTDFVRPASTPTSLKDLTSISLGTLTGTRSVNDKIYITLRFWNKVNYSVDSNLYVQVGENQTFLIGFHDGLPITIPTVAAHAIAISSTTATLTLTTLAPTGADTVRVYWYLVPNSSSVVPTRDQVLNPGTPPSGVVAGNSLETGGASATEAITVAASTVYKYYIVLRSMVDNSISAILEGTTTS
jgi:hypothetical protein